MWEYDEQDAEAVARQALDRCYEGTAERGGYDVSAYCEARAETAEQEVAALRAEVERLRRDVRTRDAMMDDMANNLVALREDKARLDWLEKFCASGVGLYGESNASVFDWDPRSSTHRAGPPQPSGAVREAVSALRDAVYGRELHDPDEMPRYVMLRVKHATALYLAAVRGERGEPVPSFWAVLRDDNETMATGKTHDEAVREFLRFRGGDYANAAKEGYRCVAIFTKWPTHPAPPAPEVGELELRQAYYEGYSDAEADPENRDRDRFHKAWLESWTYREYPAAPTERTEATPPQAAP